MVMNLITLIIEWTELFQLGVKKVKVIKNNFKILKVNIIIFNKNHFVIKSKKKVITEIIIY